MQSANKKPYVFFTGDSSSRTDTLGFDPYVEAVLDFLTDSNTKPPLTFAIEGEWGIGKSSFLDQLQKKLELLNNKPIIVRFNPWRYFSNESLWAACAIEIERQVSKNSRWYRRLLAWYLKINKLRFIKDLILLPVTIVSLILTIKLTLKCGSESCVFDNFSSLRNWLGIGLSFPLALITGKITLDIGPQLFGTLGKELTTINLQKYTKERPDYQGKIPFLQKFQDDLMPLIKVLSGKRPVYVFVDDLDRCDPQQAVELMQSIALLTSDNLNIIFVLAIDTAKIAAGFSLKHSNFIKILSPSLNEDNANQIQYGYDFFDKFIQVFFRIPGATETNINHFFDNLGTIPEPTVKLNLMEKIWKKLTDNLSGRDSIKQQQENNPKAEPQPKAIQIEYDKRIDEIKLILRLVAPVLDNNPRKIKKILNDFRLKIHIGNKTGLFGLIGDDTYPRVSLSQLAKYLVVNYKWPQFFKDVVYYNSRGMFFISILVTYNNVMRTRMDEQKDDWSYLQRDYKLTDDEFSILINVLNRWIDKPALIALIQHDLEDGPAKGTASMLTIPLSKLQEVSPVYERFGVDNSTTTPKIRVHEIAKIMNIPNSDVISTLFHEFGISVKSHSNTINQEVADRLIAILKNKIGN